MQTHEPALIGGKLRVVGVLGSGGMGKVLSAFHEGLGVRVAVKIMRDGAGGAASELTSRLLREGRAASSLRSPHVARVMDVGTLDDGSPYVVMEHVEGQTLAEVLRRRGPLPVEDAVDWTLQICEALAEAHGSSIVHRDLKPGNLMLTAGTDGSPLIKVLDFGAARTLGSDGDVSLTGSMVVLGSPRYMSPEQIRDARTVDARSDLWSLGITLYELLTDQVPFDGHTTPGILAQIAADAPPDPRTLRPDLPEGLSALVLACLEKDPAHRPADVSALATKLAPFASDEGKRSALRIPKIAARARSEVDRTVVDAAPLGASVGVSGLPAGASPDDRTETANASVHASFAKSVAADSHPTVGSVAFDASPPAISERASAHPRRGLPAWSTGAALVVGLLALLTYGMTTRGATGTPAAQPAASQTALAAAASVAAAPPISAEPKATAMPAPSAPLASSAAIGAAAPNAEKSAAPSRPNVAPRPPSKRPLLPPEDDLGPRQ